MAYEQVGAGKAPVNWQVAEQNALKRCQAWGYTRVDAFAGSTSTCTERGRGTLYNGAPLGTCARQTVHKDYQCLD